MRGPHEPPLLKRTATAEETKFLEVRIGAKGTTKRIEKFLGARKIPRCKQKRENS